MLLMTTPPMDDDIHMYANNINQESTLKYLGRRKSNRRMNDKLPALDPTLTLEEIHAHAEIHLPSPTHHLATLLASPAGETFRNGNDTSDDSAMRMKDTTTSISFSNPMPFQRLPRFKRHVLLQSFPQTRDFMMAAETLVRSWMMWTEVPSALELNMPLLSDAFILSDTSSSLSQSPNSTSLMIPLSHSFLRLLCHILCDYYHLTSTSVTIQGEKGLRVVMKKKVSTSDKVTLVQESSLLLSSLPRLSDTLEALGASSSSSLTPHHHPPRVSDTTSDDFLLVTEPADF